MSLNFELVARCFEVIVIQIKIGKSNHAPFKSRPTAPLTKILACFVLYLKIIIIIIIIKITCILLLKFFMELKNGNEILVGQTIFKGSQPGAFCP